MWNHNSMHSAGNPSDVASLANVDMGGTGKDEEENTGRSIDLKLYLQYLNQLFNEPSSGSDSSDSEDPAEDKFQPLSSGISSFRNQRPNFISNQMPINYNSCNASQSSNSNSSQSCSSFNYSPSSPTSTSSSSSSCSDNESSTACQIKVAPISDERLQELLKIHKAWKKSPYPLGSSTDIASLLSTASSKSNAVDANKSAANVTSSHRRSVDSLNSHCSSSKSRSRKQSLKVTRNEDSQANSTRAVPDSVTANHAKPVTPLCSDEAVPLESVSSVDLPLVDTLDTGGTTLKADCDIKIEEGEPLNNSPKITNGSMTEVVGPGEINLASLLEDDPDSDSDDDDNDSLSDYTSMAAAAQAGGGQMLTNPLSNLANYKNNSGGSSSSALPSSSFLGGGKARSNLDLSDVSKKKKGDKELLNKFKKISPQKQAKLIEAFNLKRRKIYVFLCKKEIGKTQRARTINHRENLTMKRRLAQACSRYMRQKAITSQKVMKESVWRAKRLTREMLNHWKQTDRVEREVRKRREKEAEEQRKLDVEIMEAKRQQRKLNFLITQTELYAHFMSKKLGGPGDDEIRILQQLEEDKNIPVNSNFSRIDEYDSELMKSKAKANVEHAFTSQANQIRLFEAGVTHTECDTEVALRLDSSAVKDGEFAQPEMFDGVLKHYQLKGMNWLINLYDQGINGILADEMGLGKTVQSMAFLAHVAERYGVWGPFLIIAPASTLHNWQQEFKRFVPRFKVVPYWGNPQERKILRQFWQQSNLHSEEASFHVVITSYQIVMADLKYFNRLKWQYVVLDEAQAIKSTTSARWKMLLGFSCRNRLLLTGTPIQNSMGELWALLHFIMPSLFDSHEEFSEWFSKDIESHAENRGSIDERHLSRLHLILKPFMLRRIKKDVENELSDKIEVLVHCPLTSRQKLLYTTLKKKIRIEDLLKSSGSTNAQLVQHATTNLMNLVMQFRKVCNHPDLFERRGIQSPYFFPKLLISLPRLLFRETLEDTLIFPTKLHLLRNRFSIFHPASVHEALSSRVNSSDFLFFNNLRSEWSFLRFTDLSPAEIYQVVYGGFSQRWQHILRLYNQYYLISRRREFSFSVEPSVSSSRSATVSCDFLLEPDNSLCFVNVRFSPVLKDLIFVNPSSTFYSFRSWKIYRNTYGQDGINRSNEKRDSIDTNEQVLKNNVEKISPEVCHIQMLRTYLPSFLYNLCPKLRAGGVDIYLSDIRASFKFSNDAENRKVVSGMSKDVPSHFQVKTAQGIAALEPTYGWSGLVVPEKEKLVSDSGKLAVLDNLLRRLKVNGHRVLIYSQMTKMIDVLEEYMWHRKWTYIRLDGSSKISERRDMVADFQSRPDIFVFLLSTRAGGLGINLTAADTVIFYDSDWNPTVDQQAMDRAHRLGQTKQVHVYRLICKGTIEERILQRAREKNEIQKMVISGGNFRPDTLKPKEVVSLLLDDEELEKKYRQRQAERTITDDSKGSDTNSRDSRLLPASVTRKKHSKGVGASGTGIGAAADGVSPSLPSSLGGSLGGSTASSPADNFQDTASGDIEAEQELYGDDGERSSSDSYAEEIDNATATLSPTMMEGFQHVNWTNDPNSDTEDDFVVLPKRPKLGRGTGKRGRPPSRIRVQRDPADAANGDASVRRGPGRPRLRPIGPANQGIRGRRPGRPPLTRKPETISSSLTPLTTSQRVFGFYSSPDLDIV